MSPRTKFPLAFVPPFAYKHVSPHVAGVAQSVEQGTENPRVGSSTLSPGTMKSRSRHAAFFFQNRAEALPSKNTVALLRPPFPFDDPGKGVRRES